MTTKTRDEEHLDLLAIFFFVLAGLNALGVCFAGLYSVIGIVMGAAGATQAGGEEGTALMAMGGVVAVFALLIAVLIGVWAWLMFLAGRKLQKRESRTFIIVIAALNLISIPLGTILGVFTIVVLSRPNVVQLFDRPAVDVPLPR